MSDASRQEKERLFGWTPSQRRGLLVLLSLLCVGLSIRYACTPTYVSNPQPERPSRYDQLANRIDPNAADWQSLAVLPGLGEKRARAIVDYRERRRQTRPNEPPFKRPTDLIAVRGINLAVVETLEPYLIFPPTTVPAGEPPARP